MLCAENALSILKREDGYPGHAVAIKGAYGLDVCQDSSASRRVKSRNRHHYRLPVAVNHIEHYRCAAPPDLISQITLSISLASEKSEIPAMPVAPAFIASRKL